jgi:hypothetical protein
LLLLSLPLVTTLQACRRHCFLHLSLSFPLRLDTGVFRKRGEETVTLIPNPLQRRMTKQKKGERKGKAIRTHTTLNFYSKRNILSPSARLSTLYHNPPQSYILHISTLYQLQNIISIF